MKKLLKYLNHYKKESVIAPLFKMLEATFELFVPLVMADIIDIGIANHDTEYILIRGVVLVALGIIGLTCSLTAQYFAAKAAVGFGTEVRNSLFCHINSLSYTELDVLGTSTLITRMTTDINQVQNGVNLFLRLFLRSPFIVFGAMIMAFTINVKAALVFVVAIPLLALVVFGVMKLSIPMYTGVQKQLDSVVLSTRENLNGARVIRAFNRQEDEKEAYREKNGLLKDLQMKVGNLSALMNPVTYVIVNLAIVAIVWTGGKEVDGGVITQGEVVALVNYMSQILVELIKLANLIVNITKSLACAERISSVLEVKTSVIEAEAAVKPEENQNAPVVEFDGVSFTYSGAGAESLTDISFRVMPGETVGIIGSTGSGKSSLVNLIPRFYDATKGVVKINGRDIKEYSLTALRDRIGVVPQKAVLFKGTIRDNMKWGKENATDEEITQALKTAQAWDFVAAKEKGLDTEITQGGSNLSGGQKQRLTIARALVKTPEVLILDDSSSALDFATDARLRAAIRENSCRSTVFIVSQRASTVRYSDKIIVLEDGMAAGIGTHEELIKTCDVYKEICMSQLSAEEV
ncbi:MAG: ABC transporter ATP-binding protein/permease [Alistipes sp.]|nr:ABC transporter ATP-binding protein/permease [Alistipes sp.]